jgi:hypothetical protein
MLGRWAEMEIRELGNLGEATRVASIPHREPSSEFGAWLKVCNMREDLVEFFRQHTPHGIRSLGVVSFIGAEAMREIDQMYSTTTGGRFVVFAQCGDGSYVSVGADSGIPTWIVKGYLEVEDLDDEEQEEAFVPYPGTLADFLISAATDEDFPFDPFDARESFS